LGDILGYHILVGRYLSTDLSNVQSIQNLEFKNLSITKSNEGLFIGPDSSSPQVIAADNLASNGVVHIINGVLLPPSQVAAAQPNIVELAQSVDDLSTLVTAVVAADLVDGLTSPGFFGIFSQLTLFAPTNEAFASLPAGTLDTLLKPENKQKLGDILGYHILVGRYLSTDLSNVQSIQNLEFKNLSITKSNEGLFIGPDSSAPQVTVADNLASNGVVHIINGVLLPPPAADKHNIIVV